MAFKSAPTSFGCEKGLYREPGSGAAFRAKVRRTYLASECCKFERFVESFTSIEEYAICHVYLWGWRPSHSKIWPIQSSNSDKNRIKRKPRPSHHKRKLAANHQQMWIQDQVLKKTQNVQTWNHKHRTIWQCYSGGQHAIWRKSQPIRRLRAVASLAAEAKEEGELHIRSVLWPWMP